MIRSEFSFGDSVEFKKNWVEPQGRWKYQPWQDQLIFKYSLLFHTPNLYHCFFWWRKQCNKLVGGWLGLCCSKQDYQFSFHSQISLEIDNYFLPDCGFPLELTGCQCQDTNCCLRLELNFKIYNLKAQAFARIKDLK